MLGLRGRMAVIAVAASAAALLVVLIVVTPGLRQRATAHERDVLLAEARLMARVVEEPLARGVGIEELDAIVDQAARDVRARVTVVAPDGRVLGDSALSGAELLAVENHGGRPEVRAAVAAGAGTSVRRSDTVRDELLYAAVAIRRGDRLVGVARVAQPLSGVEELVRDFRGGVMLALLLAFLLTALLSATLSAPLAGPLSDIMEAARRFARGDLSARIRARRGDELGELARILNQSAAELQERLTENARERARTEAILLAMDDGLLAVDHKGTVVLANAALRQILDAADPVGRHYLETIRQREVGDVLERVLGSGERASEEVELFHLRRVFYLTAVPFPGGEGAPPGAVLTFHDVTERRRADRVRRDFVANASHELRTPLTSIRGFVEALEDGALAEPDRAERFLGKIRTHADRMAALVEDLLELSRLESGERPPAWEEVLPAEIAEDVVASFASLAARKGTALQHRAGDAPAVVTDADRLRRILENLVENAIKYTAEGGRVEIRTGRGAPGGALIEVEDDGPGIAPEHLPRIFERFYRVDKARSRELGGTGLGLAIVKHLAESVGALVSVRSELARGTCFSIVVPPGRERLTPGATA
ncbi:MAG TPA: ATP-binding protein [Vicinamibacteria bacterium]|nr:ATP-binding protein [Vicinamibacteria bacterium]